MVFLLSHDHTFFTVIEEKIGGKVLAFMFRRFVMEIGQSITAQYVKTKREKRILNNKRSFKNLQPCDSLIHLCECFQGYSSFSERNEL